MTEVADTIPAFESLRLPESLKRALAGIGYENPTPIQARTIPLLLEGRDVLGQAQTGTGKTAAFALPALAAIDLSKKEPQVLVLAPTRELAIQVAEAFHRYAAHMEGFYVVPIYGGQDYTVQLRMLKRGAHVVVGTPGRVMDHMRRGTLSLEGLRCLVLDEADEMLRMGFIDDVEWVLEQAPAGRQLALFSATMPSAIRRIAQKFLVDPAEVTIAAKAATVDTIRQRYWIVGGHHKIDVLTRILEVEPFDGVIIFVRTKTMTLDLAEKLQARGYAASALNGDMGQAQRERTIAQLKDGAINIVIATDVAARGLDVERISHVINYDIPSDTESYVHRIGRTGRAGRSGEAILFVSPRERNMLRTIERVTRQKIALLELPSTEAVNDRRIDKFKQRITDTIAAEDLEFFIRLLEKYCREHDVAPLEAAAALASLYQGETPLLLSEASPGAKRKGERAGGHPEERAQHGGRQAPAREGRSGLYADEPMELYRLEVGSEHGVRAGNILGAIVNEIGLDPEAVGRIRISETFSMVELPQGMPNDVFHELRNVRVCGRPLRLSKADARQEEKRERRRPAAKERFFTGPGRKRKY